uniref:WD repeat-containing protein on Y chromosome n=1 Tax=Anopheles melas TaxID=34690 RepID=A0A182TKH4_9DIPT
MSELVEYYPVEDVQHEEHIHHRCHPLHLTWVSGFNPRVSLLNVSTSRDRKELVLASGNALLFYCYDGEREKITPVIGHAIHFCPDRGRRNQFVVTLDSGVVFGAWDCKEQKLSIQVPKRHGFQDYNDTVFVERTDRAVSVTGAGMAVLWSNDRKFSDALEGVVQRKEFLKYLHLKYASINVVRSCDEKIVTGDDDGEIRFYDNSMKILYWFKQEDLEPIRTLSFELVETRRWKQPAEPIEGDDQTPKEESTEKKVVVNIEDIAPKDVSFDARPVIVRGFVSATKSGKIYDIDIVYNKIQELFLQSPSIITAFDVHSARSELCTCDGNGRFVVYDLKTKSMRLALDVPIQRTRRGRITTLAYSTCGTFLAGGAENGFLWMVEPNLMILAGSSPLQFTSEKIRLVLFSLDSKHLVCADESNTITLLHREKDDWQVMGNCATHRLVDLAFLSATDFVSIGEDRLRDAMNVQDVPNYLRSVGFHMSEYEEQNLCKEMELTGTYFLTFEEVLKLFLNHRTSAGGPPTSEDVRTAVTYIGATTSSGKVDLVRLITLLASMGEPMEPKTTEAYCRILFPTAFEANEQDGSPAPKCGTGEDCTNYIAIDEFADRLC